MNKTKQYINNEIKVLEEDFHKMFYFVLGNSVVLKQMLPTLLKSSGLTNDFKGTNYAIKLQNAINTIIILSESIESHFKVPDRNVKENYKEMFADITRIIGITIATTPFDRLDAFASLLISFNQGDYTQVEEHLIDSLLDYEENKTIEGLGLVQRYAPNLTVEQKEEFAKDLVKWADMRQMTKL